MSPHTTRRGTWRRRGAPAGGRARRAGHSGPAGEDPQDTTLWLLGGISELGGEAPGPAAEARIAAPARLAVVLADRLVPRRVGHGRGAAGRPGQPAARHPGQPGHDAGPVTLPRSMTIREFIDDYMFRARHQSFPVTGDGGDTVTGFVTLDRIKHAPAEPA